MIRSVLVAATIAALFAMWMERPDEIRYFPDQAEIALLPEMTVTKYYPDQAEIPLPVVNQVDYCFLTQNYKIAFKDQFGEWHTGWGMGYGPCYLLDRDEIT